VGETVFTDFDPTQPLDAGRTEPPGHHKASRESMIGWEHLAVHGQRDQGVVGARFGQRHRQAGPDLVEPF
jgi:hypothetical protein